MDSHVVLVYKSEGLPRVRAPWAPLGRPRPSDWLTLVRRPGLVSSHSQRRRMQRERQEQGQGPAAKGSRAREPLLRLSEKRLAPWSAVRVKRSLRLLLHETASSALADAKPLAEHGICRVLSRSAVGEVNEPKTCWTETTTDLLHYYYPSTSPSKAKFSSQNVETKSDNYQTQVTQILSGRCRVLQMGKQATATARAGQESKASTKVWNQARQDSSAKAEIENFQFKSKIATGDSLPKANAEIQVDVSALSISEAKVDSEALSKTIVKAGMWEGATNKSEVEAKKEGREKEEAKVKDDMKPEMQSGSWNASKAEEHERMENVDNRNKRKSDLHEYINENWDKKLQPMYDSEISSDDCSEMESEVDSVKPENARHTTHDKFLKANLKLEQCSPVAKALALMMENAITEIRAIRKIEIKPKIKESSISISEVRSKNKTPEKETDAKEVVGNALNNGVDIESEEKAGAVLGSQKINEYIFKSEKNKKDVMKKEEHSERIHKLVQNNHEQGEEIGKTDEKTRVGLAKMEGIQMNKIKWAGRKNIMMKSQLSKKEIINTDRNQSSANKGEGSKQYGITGERTDNSLIKGVRSKRDGFTVKRVKKLRLKAESQMRLQTEEKNHIQEIINFIKRTKLDGGKQALVKKKTEGGMKENKEIVMKGEVKAKARAEIKTKSEMEDQTHEKTESTASETNEGRKKATLKKSVTFSDRTKIKRATNAKSKAEVVSTKSNVEVESKAKIKLEANVKKRTKEEFEAKAKEKLEEEERLGDKAVSEGKTKSEGRARDKEDAGLRERYKTEGVAKAKAKEETEPKSKAEIAANEKVKVELDQQPELKVESHAKSKFKEEPDAQAKVKGRIDAMNKAIAGVEALARRRMAAESKAKPKQETESPETTKDENEDKDLTISAKADAGNNARNRAESEPRARNKSETDYKAKVRAESEPRVKNQTETDSNAKVRVAVGVVSKAETEIGAVAKATEKGATKTAINQETKSESEDKTKPKVQGGSKAKTSPETKPSVAGKANTNALATGHPEGKPQALSKANAEAAAEAKGSESVQVQAKASMVDAEATVNVPKFIAPKIALLLCDSRDHCPFDLSQWKFPDFNCPILTQNNVDTSHEIAKPTLLRSNDVQTNFAMNYKDIAARIPPIIIPTRPQAPHAMPLLPPQSRATQTPSPASTQTTSPTSAPSQAGASTQTPTSLPTLLSLLSRTLQPSASLTPAAPATLATPATPRTKTASTTTTSKACAFAACRRTSSTQTEIGSFRRKRDAAAATTTTTTISPSMIKEYQWGS